MDLTYLVFQNMPAQAQNGSNTGASGLECAENASFLFTSESVGEGHPGEKTIFRTASDRPRGQKVKMFKM